MEQTSILVVDDNHANLRLAEFLLTRHGMAVRTAASAADALAALRAQRPDLILMDLQMPGVDGFELTRQLKADAAHRELVVVALTAYAMKGDEERARAAGCDGFIPKPIDTRTFSDRIRQFVAAGPQPPAGPGPGAGGAAGRAGGAGGSDAAGDGGKR